MQHHNGLIQVNADQNPTVDMPWSGATITIETAQEPVYDTAMFGMETDGLLAIALVGLVLLTLGFEIFHIISLKRLRKRLQRIHQREMSTDLVMKLCDKNQLIRLDAIQRLGRMGAENQLARQRAANIIGAYLKALTADGDLRKTAKAEIMACLTELSLFCQQTEAPLKVDVSNLKFEDMHLQDLTFKGLDMRGLLVKDCQLENVDFTETNLRDGVFRRCVMDQIDFRGATLQGLCFAAVEWRDLDGLDKSILEAASGQEKDNQRLAAMLAMEDAPLDKSKLH